MPDKTKGQGFSKIITQRLEAGSLEILLQVEVNENGGTTVTVFKGLKKAEPKIASHTSEGSKTEVPEPEDRKPKGN